MKVAILGAPGSGKTRLAVDLVQHLQNQGLTGHEVCEESAPGRLNSGSKLADLFILCGLDLAATRSPPDQQQAIDTALRQTLQHAGLSFHVVYGLGPARSAQALRVVQHYLRLLLPPTPADEAPSPTSVWVWACEQCSDPGCEHRLFTERIQRDAAASY